MNIEGYITRLREFPEFDSREGATLLEFSYAGAAEERLVFLRGAYGIAPATSSVDLLPQALDSMSWVFGQFRHTGSAVDIPATNALDILARADEGTFDCTHKAVVLNEVLLARGLPSRVITCIPQHFDMDRHVAVIVFAAEQNKWVFLDPTFNTYFPDGQAGALGPIEIRDAYRQGRNPSFAEIPIDKQWTLALAGKEYDSYQDWYTTYMAKNCFRFSSPTVSSFGSSGSSATQMAFLNPTGYCHRNEYDDLGARHRPNVYTHSTSDFLCPPA